MESNNNNSLHNLGNEYGAATSDLDDDCASGIAVYGSTAAGTTSSTLQSKMDQQQLARRRKEVELLGFCELGSTVSHRVESVLRSIERCHVKERPADRSVRSNLTSHRTIAFTLRQPSVIHFFDAFSLQEHLSDLFQSFYLVKDHHQMDTYLLHFRLVGFAPRKKIIVLVQQLVAAMAHLQVAQVSIRPLQTCSPCLIASIFRDRAGHLKENIYVMMKGEQESRIKTAEFIKEMDLVTQVQLLTDTFVSNMTKVCLAPHSFDTLLKPLQKMTPALLKAFLKQRDLESIFKQVQGQIFEMSVFQICNDPVGRLVLGNECVRLQIYQETYNTIYKPFLLCVLGTSNQQLDHPPLFYSLKKNLPELHSAEVADISVYHGDFIVPLLLVARYFARVCMQQIDNISSNGAALLLYGAAGAGKSIITNALAKFMNGYKWNVDSLYQTPSLLSASVIIIEEAKLSQMAEPLYKQLLDITSYVKVETKHAHPIDATRHCPVVLNTNEHVYDYFRGVDTSHQMGSGGRYNNNNSGGSYQGRQQNRGRAHFTDEQLAAVRRRFVVVPFLEKFSSLHEMSHSMQQDDKYNQLFVKFSNMDKVQASLFNFLLAFGLYQTSLSKFEIVESMTGFMYKLVLDFNKTVFGRAYLSHKDAIDKLLDDTESCLNNEVPNDRDMFKLFCKTSEQLNTFMDANYMELIIGAQDSSRLAQHWHNGSDWHDQNKFMRKLTLLQDDCFRDSKAWRPPKLDKIALQWRLLIQSYISPEDQIHALSSSELEDESDEEENYPSKSTATPQDKFTHQEEDAEEEDEDMQVLGRPL